MEMGSNQPEATLRSAYRRLGRRGGFEEPILGVAVALAHLVFNLGIALIFLPMLNRAEPLLRRRLIVGAGDAEDGGTS